jgi:hypothetical protein
LFKEWQYDGENARMMVGHQQSGPAGPFRAIVRFWQILLQKSQKAQRLIFRQRMKQATIADQ